MDKQLKGLLGETLVINAASSHNFNDEITVSGTSVSVSCRIQRKIKVISDQEGKQIVSTCQIFVDGGVSIGAEDKITLPGGSTPKILGIFSSPDEFGETYYKCIYT